MSFPDVLENFGSIQEFESTKNEFRNFWNLVKDIDTIDPVMAKQYIDVIYEGEQKRYDALRLINKSANIRNIFPQLTSVLLDEMQIIYAGRPQVFQALLETKNIKAMHNELKKYPHLLDALNTLSPIYCVNLFDQAIDPEVWLKISSIQDTGTLHRFFVNIAFGELSYMIATGFLALAQESTFDDFCALIDLYQTTHLDIIQIVDQGLNDKTLVVEIHKLFMDTSIPLANKQALLKGLTGFVISSPQEKLMWQQKISANLFTPSHTDIISVLKQLLSISQSTILTGFLSLTVKFGNNGYTQIQFLLRAILKDDKPHPILTEMNTLKSDDVVLLIQELVWTNHGDIFVAQKFLDFTAGLSLTTLNQFLAVYLDSVRQTYVFPHLLQSIENTTAKIYSHLCSEKGVIYKDLILELQMLDSTIRHSILADGSVTLFRKLRKLEGLPFLLSGVLQIGRTDDSSEKLQERYILDFIDTVTNSTDDQHSLKNIAYAINALNNRQLTRTFVPLIYSKPLAMDRISCDNVPQGQEKSIILLNALCSPDGTVRKTFISSILNDKTVSGIVDGLFTQGIDGAWQVLFGFINVIDDQMTDDNIVDQYNSFLLSDNDPYRFIRLIAQMANNTQKAEQYYRVLIQQEIAERKRMIVDIMVFGKVELLFSSILQDSEFQQWQQIRQNSEPIYHALLLLLSKMDDDHMKELRILIYSKMIQTEAYKDILDDFDIQISTNSSYRINYQKIMNFVTELQNNPNFLSVLQEAFHEKIPKEFEACVRFVVKLYNKEVILEAFDRLAPEQAILLIKAFAGGYDDLLDMLNQLNSVVRCTQLLKRFCFENPNNANYPISLCSNMMKCLDDSSITDVLQSFTDVKTANEDKVFFDFETVLSTLSVHNPQIIDHAKTLLQQQVFMFIIKLFDTETRQKLLAEILENANDSIRVLCQLSPNVLLPFLATYRKAGDFSRISILCQQIFSTPGFMDTLQYFTHTNKDVYAKLLISVLAVSISENFEIDMKKIERLKQAVAYFGNLREALFRFAARSNIYPSQLFILLKYFLEENILYTSNGKINASFDFPQKQMVVSEDHWIYDQFLAATDFYNKK